jgi:hypothetical protein
MNRWQLAIGLALLLAAAPDEAIACSCEGPTEPCEAAWWADVVFVGAAVQFEDVQRESRGNRYTRRVATFEVARGFVNASARRIAVETVPNPDSCGIVYEPGRQYLVYARKDENGRLFTRMCSRTQPIETAAVDLRYLSTLPPSSSGARVYGRVTEWRRKPHEQRAVVNPVEGLVVNVRGIGFSIDAVTDGDGRYEITGLPVGRATLRALASGYDARDLQREVELKSTPPCGPHNFRLEQTSAAPDSRRER